MIPIHSFVNLLKPPGMTSHDVVDVVRRATDVRQVGHAGTLDPGASGVLVVGIGFAVRLIEFMSDSSKTYRAEITFGIETDTGDAQGNVTRVSDASDLTEETLREALKTFVGGIHQCPPPHSAVQVGGRRLYELARRGIALIAPAREVYVHRIDLLRFNKEEWKERCGESGLHSCSFPAFTATLDIDCSSGAYIRSLATDLGARLGCGAHLSFLVRTRVGVFRIEESITLERLADAARRGEIADMLIPPQVALAPMPVVTVKDEQKRSAVKGNPIIVTTGSGFPDVAVGTGRARASRRGDMHVLPNPERRNASMALIQDEDARVIAIARCESRSEGIALRPVKVIREVPATCA